MPGSSRAASQKDSVATAHAANMTTRIRSCHGFGSTASAAKAATPSGPRAVVTDGDGVSVLVAFVDALRVRVS